MSILHIQIGYSPTTLLIFTILVLVLGLCIAAIWIGWWMQNRGRTLSPYTGLPLRKTTELSYSSLAKVHNYLTSYLQYDNRMFIIRRASYCRDTGRIFPDSVTWFGEIKMNWGFLRKRYPGNWISWGSLNKDQQDAVRAFHETLADFQTEFSCPEPAPRYIDDKFVYSKPGPLYVDLDSKTLLGWKSIPDSDLEVLIVQKPNKQSLRL